ncbi:Monogalactosyldiacylglycerol synthase 1, chloroplastic [Cymbomonas tetramitiformis]|uniref:Monogalactosyldiacylglycerol synthase 1, chloroplastic n=1 Tax=Cymbomonas tetramitiformis TaxID=36881 RepID=A0AAE0BEW0_9CHLO|nr:Monogalactosyldiacylglycerol synthase 1, chloroplastic [Cymbomonas tetramitiformis]
MRSTQQPSCRGRLKPLEALLQTRFHPCPPGGLWSSKAAGPCTVMEEDNIPYVVDNKVGTFESKPKKIAQIVSDWFGPKRDELEAMAVRAKAMGRPKATFRIVEDLAGLIDEAAAKQKAASQLKLQAA